MCGILALFGVYPKIPSLKPLEHRGPDEKGVFTTEQVYMGHTRLSIVNPEAGSQPIFWKDWIVIINGEIYNADLNGKGTDCFVVPPLLEQLDKKAPTQLDGVFSFVAYRKTDQKISVERDAIGVTPLYMGTSNGVICFSSLLAAIPIEFTCEIIPPGHSSSFHLNKIPTFEAWKSPYNPWSDLKLTTTDSDIFIQIMFKAVEKRLMGDVPWGVLLSGGLDSTIVTAIVSLLASKRPDYPKVHTFCIGLHDSPDVLWANKVANELGTHHTSVVYTVEDAIEAIPAVIKAVETYDVTTIRASIPMWLLARAIKRRGIKMVLSGEGSDELFAGYLYNLYCPSERHMVDECIRKMDQLHSYDCARANKSMGDWGVETRVPFLDKEVVRFAMDILHPQYKMSKTHPEGEKPEKWWLRETFRPYVPECVVERTKAQFSDAVGSRHILELQKAADTLITDDMMSKAGRRFPYNTPTTKEAYWYRHLFSSHFQQGDAEKTVLFTPNSIACSTGDASTWHENFKKCLDPSGDAIQTAFA